ncbi:MAG: tRNA adenosine(34) deaminase TadA [Desulfomonilaceae bacterium]
MNKLDLSSYSDKDDQHFMGVALVLAHRAFSLGETPVGAVIIKNKRIIGTGFNRVELDHDPTAHAEIVALRKATRNQRDWRLKEATLYVSLEPCIMCAAALLNARVRRVVFGAWDNRHGAFGSLFDLSHDPRFNHEIEVKPGLMREKSATLLREFFRQQRRDAREVEGG